jgi:hypothetical protein
MTNDLVTIVPVALWLAAIASTVAALVLRSGQFELRAVVEELLRYLFIFPLGVQGLWAFTGHVFLPEESAGTIGWAPSPFQYDVGVANLGIGLASFYAAFSGFQARAAVAVAAGCFLAGAGYGHVMNILAGDTLSPGNSGPILVTNFLTPTVVLALLVAFPKASTTSADREKQAASRAQPAKQPLQSRLSQLASAGRTPPKAPVSGGSPGANPAAPPNPAAAKTNPFPSGSRKAGR